MFNIIGTLPEDRQTIVLYNDPSDGVDKLANKITENEMVTVTHGEAVAVTRPVHTVWWVEEGAKKMKLLSLLANDKLYR